jgi:hypothetical protein
MDIAELAKSKIGVDASPKDNAPDELACAESVSTILREIDPTFPLLLSTERMYIYLVSSKKWQKILTPEAGCIVISPTGYQMSSRPDMPNGHVGLYITDNLICSNDSATGKWKQNYTRESWRERYYYGYHKHPYPVYPVFCFKKVA